MARNSWPLPVPCIMEFLTFDSEGEGGAVQYLDKADRVADRPDCDRAKLLL